MFARQQFFIIRSLIRNSTSNYVLNYVIRHINICKRITQKLHVIQFLLHAIILCMLFNLGLLSYYELRNFLNICFKYEMSCTLFARQQFFIIHSLLFVIQHPIMC